MTIKTFFEIKKSGLSKNAFMRTTQYIGGIVGMLILFLMEFILLLIPLRITPGRDQMPLGELLLALGLNLILVFVLIRKRWPWIFRGAFMGFLILLCFVLVFIIAGAL